MAYTNPQQWEKEERERLREGGVISGLLILDFKEGKLQDSGKQEEGNMFHELHFLGMIDDLCDRVCGVGSATWKVLTIDCSLKSIVCGMKLADRRTVYSGG